MYYYLKGSVAVIENALVVIDCAGVGYACHTSMKSVSVLKVGESAKLYTYCHIREDTFDIYGFVTQSELSCFKMLISVSGVGPKAALSVLSSTTPEDLAYAIISGNEKALTAAAGIGKKTAQRIILELKDKIGKDLDQIPDSDISGALLSAAENGGKTADAAAALTVLGYTPNEINAAFKTMDLAALSTEEIIKEVLKKSLK